MKKENTDNRTPDFNGSKKAFTFVELIVAMGIAAMVMLFITRLASFFQMNYMHGTINLANLQEARMALAHLRRDFNSSCPLLAESDGYIVLLKTLQDPIKFTPEAIEGQKTLPIEISAKAATFTRYLFATTDGLNTPATEQISYYFDEATNTLIRKTSSDTVNRFKGIRDVNFEIYLPPTNPNVPLLRVRLELLDEESAKTIGNPQPLCVSASFSSAFLNSTLNHLSWNYSTWHNTGSP